MRKNNLHYAIKAYGKGGSLFTVSFFGKIVSIILLFLSISGYAQTVENKAVFIQGDGIIYSTDSDFNKHIDDKSAHKETINLVDSLGTKSEAIVFRAEKADAPQHETERFAKEPPKTFSEKLAAKKVKKVEVVQHQSTEIIITLKPLSSKEHFVAGVALHKILYHQCKDYTLRSQNVVAAYVGERYCKDVFSIVKHQFSHDFYSLLHGRAPPYLV